MRMKVMRLLDFTVYALAKNVCQVIWKNVR